MESSSNCAQSSVECIHCQKSASHFCNTCGEAMCSKCKQRHLKRQKSHQVVLFKDRQNPNMVVEKCRIHPELLYLMVCENCSVPVCTKCIKDNHRGHIFEDLYEDFITKHDFCKQVVNNLKREVLPQSHALLSDVKNDFITCKNAFDDIRSDMVLASNKLKDAIDNILKEKISGVDKMEANAEATLTEQEHVLNEHIQNLEEIISKYEQIEKVNKPSEFIMFHKNNNIKKIQDIPELYHVIFPSFVKKEVEPTVLKTQFGMLKETYLTPIVRKLKTTKIVDEKCIKKRENITFLETKKIQKSIKFQEEAKNTYEMYETSILEKVSKTQIDGIGHTRHMTHTGNNMWISDDRGSLVLSDIKGKIIDRVNEEIYGDDGFHTVTQSGDLLIVNDTKNIVSKRSPDKKLKTVINTPDEWSPKAIYCSPLTGHIVIAHIKAETVNFPIEELKAGNGMVAVYDSSYEKVSEIISAEYVNELYIVPYYVTQNINGDIIVSDYAKKSVIAVNEKSEIEVFRFEYKGHPIDPGFHPSGVCCDSNGNILIFNSSCRTVHLLDIHGFLVSRILHLPSSIQRGVFATGPNGICCDGKGNLWIGEHLSPVVRIFKYNNSRTLLEQHFLQTILK